MQEDHEFKVGLNYKARPVSKIQRPETITKIQTFLSF